MKSNEIRKKFLDFFEKNKKLPHVVVESSNLIPPNDTSVLFSIAGMQQFKPYFLDNASSAKRDFGSTRLTSSQKCFRVTDIDQIGDATHLTFFEMLGNFSIGNYFKKDAIELAWEFVTKKLGIPQSRIVVTYFSGDKNQALKEDIEAKSIWASLGVSPDRIIGKGMDETFWGPPGTTGPCGPSTEIHIDLEPNKPFQFDQHRFVEIWNIVFMEFEKNSKGHYKELKQKNIDTGMGLERLEMVLNGFPSVFETSILSAIVKQIAKDPAFDTTVGDTVARTRIVADHLRSTIFLLADNLTFGKKEQQAVLRRIFRKALDQYRGRNANLKPIVSLVATIYEDSYPEIKQRAQQILDSMLAEQQMYQNIRERKVGDYLKKIKHASVVQSETEALKGPSGRTLSADEAFQLFATHGFSLDQLRNEGYSFDQDEVNKKIEAHKEKSKEGAEKKFGGHGLDTVNAEHIPENERIMITRLHTATHLLHSALRKILGDSVQQQGSDINSERLRFDFAFERKLTEDEKIKIQKMVNETIDGGYDVIREEMPLDDALAKGALAFFREKYPNTVSVYSVVHPERQEVYSMELCGGPHVKKTSELGKFTIVSEKSIAKGIRRIKAILEPS